MSSVLKVNEIIDAINKTCKAMGGHYAEYSCQQVSWNDNARDTVGGKLSSIGRNITDSRLYDYNGRLLYTVRPSNWNDKLGVVSAEQLAVIDGNHQPSSKDTEDNTQTDLS